jgi:predicted Zn-dependent protease
MKKLNTRLILGLILGTLFSAVGVHFLHRYQMGRSVSSLLARSEKAGADGDVEEQVKLLRRYLQHQPKDLTQLKTLLKVSREQAMSADSIDVRELNKLLQALEAAIRENPEDTGLRREGFEFNASVGRWADAIEHSQTLAAANQLTSTDEVMLARCLYQDSQVDLAIEKLAGMVGFNATTNEFDGEGTAPKEVGAYEMLAGLILKEKTRENDLTIPLKVLDRMVEANPDSAQPLLRRAAFVQQADPKQEERIAKDIAEALKIAPDDAQVIVSSARMAMQNRKFEEAEQLLKRGIEKYPEDPRMYAGLGDMYLQQNEMAEALKVVDAGLEKIRLQSDLMWMRANLQMELGQLKEAEDTIERLSIKSNVDMARIQLLNARMTMAKGDYPTAVQSLEKLLPLLDYNPTLRNRAVRMLADGYKRLGQWDKLPGLLPGEEGSKVSGDQLLTRAEAMQAQGNLEEALRIYLDLMSRSEDLTPQGRELVFGRIYQLRILQQRQLPPERRDWKEVDRMTAALLKREDLAPESKEQLRIDMLIQKDDLAEARKRAERAVAQFPRHQPFYMFLNRLTKDPEQGAKILQQVSQSFGDSVELRTARADRITEIGGEKMAEELAKLETNVDKLSSEEQLQLWQAFAMMYDRAGMPAKAIEMWRKLLAKPGNENNMYIRQLMFELAMAAGDDATMDEMTKEVRRFTGATSSETLMMEATRAVREMQLGKRDKSSLNDVADMVEKIRLARPDFGPVYALQADVQILRGDKDRAVESLEQALARRPGEPRMLRKMVDLLTQLGRMKDASRYLAQLPEGQRAGGDILSEIRVLLSQDPEKAYERITKAVPDGTKDPEQLLLRAEVEAATKHADEARKTLEALISVDPKRARAYLLYVRALVELDRKADAEAAIAKIEGNVDAAELPLLLGQCYVTVGKLEEAVAAYDRGLVKQPNDPVLLRNKILLHMALNRSDSANSSLDTLIASAKGDSAADRDSLFWARRVKAQILNKSGNYQDFQSALKLLEENKDPESGELTEEDQLLWLGYSARRAEAASRQKAIARLNEIQLQRKLTGNETEVLAYLYKIEGRWEDAKRLMVNIVTSNPQNAQFLASYVEWLLEANEFSDAAVWLQKLDPNTPAAIRFRAILLTKQKKEKDAAKLLLGAVSASKLDLPSSVQILEELGKDNPSFFKLADTQWKKLVQQSPGQKPAYIEFLTRYPKAGKLGEALDAAEGEIKKAIAAKDNEATQYYLGIALNGLRAQRRFLPKDSPLFGKVAGWFDLLRTSSLDPLAVSWSEVDYYDIRQDYKKLESLYVELLKNTALNEFQQAVIRNNLAYGYAISNQGQKALDTIGDAIQQLGPRSDFLDTRGLAYLASNQADLAVKDLREAVSGGDGTASTYFHLALAESKSENMEAAAEAMKRAMDLGLSENELSPAEVALFRQLRKTLSETTQATSSERPE